jgi:hypothetical protein
MTVTPDKDGLAAGTETARKAIRDGIDTARTHVNEAARGAYTRTKDGIDQARGAVSDAYAAGRDRAADAYATARRSAADGIEANPVAVLLGGLAVGAVIGALLPRTDRESKVLGAVGDKLHGAAHEATQAARAAGRDKLAELGISQDKARDVMKTLLDGLIAAAGTASSAAVNSTRKGSDETGKADS